MQISVQEILQIVTEGEVQRAEDQRKNQAIIDKLEFEKKNLNQILEKQAGIIRKLEDDIDDNNLKIEKQAQRINEQSKNLDCCRRYIDGLKRRLSPLLKFWNAKHKEKWSFDGLNFFTEKK